MRLIRTALLALATVTLMNAEVYELRTYTCHEGKLPDLLNRFKNHTMRIFERHGMKNVMYWLPEDEPLKSTTLIYVITHASREAAKSNWDSFRKDPEWIKVKADSEKAGPITIKTESVFMDILPWSPKH